MAQLIFVLGYTLNKDNTIPSTLKQRLLYAVDLFNKNKNRIIIVTGSKPYTGNMSATKTQASVMKEFLLNKRIPKEKIFTEDKTQSAIEQLCWLRDKIEKKSFPFDQINKIYIIASQWFDKRVKIFCKYILYQSIDYKVVGVKVDKKIENEFKNTEEEKFKQTQEWFQKEFKYGDYKLILKKQLEFQNNKLKQKGYPVQKKI